MFFSKLVQGSSKPLYVLIWSLHQEFLKWTKSPQAVVTWAAGVFKKTQFFYFYEL